MYDLNRSCVQQEGGETVNLMVKDLGAQWPDER